MPFFGRPAYTPVGAAKMALRHGMRVIPTFLERRPDGRHLARFLPALELPGDATAATAVMTAAIEEQIRRVPEQWVWWHRRWRTQPGATTTAGNSPASSPRRRPRQVSETASSFFFLPAPASAAAPTPSR